MLVKIEARILIFPGTDFHFPSTSVPPGTFLRLCYGVHNFRRTKFIHDTSRKNSIEKYAKTRSYNVSVSGKHWLVGLLKPTFEKKWTFLRHN